MESIGIRFEVQWKKKSGVVGRREDATSIGLWDPENSTLDWRTFKTYLSQNLGTLDDISVAYVDSDGDELPIESQCEFQEALKFAKDRARKGRETVLRVDRQGSSLIPPATSRSSGNVQSKPLAVRADKAKPKKSSKTVHKVSGVGGQEEKKIKLKNHSSCGDRQILEQDKMELTPKVTENLKAKADNVSTCSLTGVADEEKAPQWFRKYMQKMKSEMITEITALVLHGVQQMLESPSQNGVNAPCTAAKLKKKKKVVDDNSSDDGLENDPRDQELLKKIEKLHKREKKFEKKLDSKLEKLESKTKKLMEKKSVKAKIERTSEKKTNLSSRKKTSDVTGLLDVLVLHEHPKAEMCVQPGTRFTKLWEILNIGTVPWCDKTELRHSWSTNGLTSDNNVIKVPPLEPGKGGLISARFQAPECPGTYESYWHFYHKAERFGHWIQCTVVVEPVEQQHDRQHLPDKELLEENKNQTEHPVDLTVKTKVDQQLNCSPVDVGSGVNITENEPTAPKPRDPELVIESDSDNLSVISGTVSLSSESEGDEDFVVVQMPACFLCDVPLGSVDKVPVLVKENKKKIVNGDDPFENYPKSIDMIQLSSDKQQNTDQQCTVIGNHKSENIAEEKEHLLLEVNKESPTNDEESQQMATLTESLFVNFSTENMNGNLGESAEVTEIPSSQQRSPRTVTLSENLYVQFSNNNMNEKLDMPAERLEIPSSDQQNQRRITVTDSDDLFVEFSNDNMNRKLGRDTEIPNAGEMKSPGRVFAVDTEGHCRVETVQPNQSVKFEKLSDQRVYAVDMAGHCMPVETTHFGARTESSSTTSSTYSTTSSSRSSSFSHHHTEDHSSPQKPSPTQNQGNGSTHQQTSPPIHDPLGNVIHILPETLVSGAVNVATSAFSTARAVISNLRSRQPGDFTDWNWNTTGGGDIPSSTDRSTTESLNLLVEMGFTNKVLNVLLLQRYDNDVAKVVAELVAYNEHAAKANGYRM